MLYPTPPHPQPDDPHLSPQVNYIRVDAQVRPPLDYSVPWVVTSITPTSNQSSPQLRVGSNIQMLDSERFQMNGRAIMRKGSLEAIFSMEKGYIIYTLLAHEQGPTDIYGTHHMHSRVAIPHHLVHLNPIAAISYYIRFSKLNKSIGQTSTERVVHPPRRSFADSHYYQRTREQKQQDMEHIMVMAEAHIKSD
ncbi:hypothetical protein PILCRDRAFT_17458 [Piloderma croceum F 1598]|uniref:Uncharacterized protein n=1 Tax=Piloderma croceum (strain F 1598) TaxID=765440 RepID=A0A0C3AB74_PILCF|nr:hypothetical protein PILCRDRAFT_17458 [Piloderma croceum F 1598]